MDKITIETDDKIASNLMGRLLLLWSRARVRRSVSATILFTLFIAIALTEYPEYRGTLLLLVIFVAGMWISPIASLLIDIVIGHKDQAKQESRLTISINESGVEAGFKTYKVLYKWDGFCGFRETKKRFKLITKRIVDNDILIAKRYMSEEQIDEVRKTLSSYLEEFK
ncbi:MAG: hypothetical protein ACYS6I_00835 [Planctomycetota bacterium]|jgi:hypothetical protein